MKKNGILFIVTGACGAGKTTLAKKMENEFKGKIKIAATYTTRKKRDGEIEFLDYIFVSIEKFLKLKEQKFFLEDVSIGENFYGTPKKYLERLQNGENLILIIDGKGLLEWKKKYNKLFSIFIDCSDEEILKRIMLRDIKFLEEIEVRCKKNNMEREMEKSNNFIDLIIYNNNFNL